MRETVEIMSTALDRVQRTGSEVQGGCYSISFVRKTGLFERVEATSFFAVCAGSMVRCSMMSFATMTAASREVWGKRVQV